MGFSYSFEGAFGYIHSDFINTNYDFIAFIQNQKDEAIILENNKINIASIEGDIKFDSIKAINVDSSYLFIRPKDLSITYLYDSPHRNIIAELTKKDIFKVIGIHKVDFPKVKGVTNELEGCVYLPHFESTNLLSEYLNIKIEEQNRVAKEAKVEIEEKKLMEEQSKRKVQEMKDEEIRNKQKFEFDSSKKGKQNKSLAFGKISDWKNATESEKLKVCRGFTDSYNNLNPPYKISAIDLMICIDTATSGLDATNDITIQTMVILCMKEINKLN